MFRSLLLLSIFITIATSTMCLASDQKDVPTRLKVYNVGNIVSATAMTAKLNGKSTSNEWAAEYAETTKALRDLLELIESLCLEKPAAIKAYVPSLSLIVRHTEKGHQDIEAILDQLGATRGPMIELECSYVANEGSAETKAAFAKLTDPEQQRYAILQAKKKLAKAETVELKALTDRIPDFAAAQETVLLQPGQRTPFELLNWPATAMARVNQEKRTIDLRIDAINDDIGEFVSFSTNAISLSEGESARFFHIADGGLSVWRVTAKVVDPVP